MHKIWLIIQREYLVRVRKKSFIIMTILGPLLMGLLFVVPVFLATYSDSTDTVEILDKSGFFADTFQDKANMKFISVDGTLEQAKEEFLDSDHTALLYIPEMDLEQPEGIKLFSEKNASISTLTSIENLLEKKIEQVKFKQSGIDKEVLDKIKTEITIATVNLSESGEKDNNALVTSGIGLIGAVLIYFFIFLYGVQIMRGVIEEKTSRIVEVIISSVKPFQLMMGKIVGIAAVGITQFMLWIILSMAVFTFISSKFELDRFKDDKFEQTIQTSPDVDQAREMNSIVSALDNVNVPLLVGCFIFYFLGGYLLYGALFGAVGAAVDNETDSQQFMLPITIPLIISIVVAQSLILKNPDGPVAFWMSMIPFTSPIVMMIRIPFGVPITEILLSMGFLVLGFIATTWLAGRVYRVGILMYGKKVNYREISKWLFYKV